MLYTIAPSHVERVFELAQQLGLPMYKKRLNSWIYSWVVDLPEDSVYTTRMLLEFSSVLTQVYGTS